MFGIRIQICKIHMFLGLQDTDPYILNQRVWFIEGQAFSRSYDLVPRPPWTPPPLPLVSSTEETLEDWEGKRDNLLPEEGGKGWARSQIIRPQESLVLDESFNTLLFEHTGCQCQSRNSPGFDASILRRCGIWGAADQTVQAVLNQVLKKPSKNLP